MLPLVDEHLLAACCMLQSTPQCKHTKCQGKGCMRLHSILTLPVTVQVPTRSGSPLAPVANGHPRLEAPEKPFHGTELLQYTKFSHLVPARVRPCLHACL